MRRKLHEGQINPNKELTEMNIKFMVLLVSVLVMVTTSSSLGADVCQRWGDWSNVPKIKKCGPCQNGVNICETITPTSGEGCGLQYRECEDCESTAWQGRGTGEPPCGVEFNYTIEHC